MGDEILEINSQSTQGMSHSDAINLIQSGGTRVQLLIRRTGQIPNNLGGMYCCYNTKLVMYNIVVLLSGYFFIK